MYFVSGCILYAHFTIGTKPFSYYKIIFLNNCLKYEKYETFKYLIILYQVMEFLSVLFQRVTRLHSGSTNLQNKFRIRLGLGLGDKNAEIAVQ